MIARIFRLAAFGAAAFEYQDVIGEQGQSIDFVPMIKRGMKGVDHGSGLERRRCERRTCRCRFGRFVRIDSRDGARSDKRRDAPAPNLTHPCSPDLPRSEEHTSELQSLMRISYAVFCLTKKHTYTQ